MKILFIILALIPFISQAQLQVSKKVENSKTHFALSSENKNAILHFDIKENALIKRATEFLASDIEKVTGNLPTISTQADQLSGKVIIIGTVDNNQVINQLVNEKKINVDPIRNNWEQFIIQSVDQPTPGIEEALVIVGSDRRGAAFGVFSLSKGIGVSPWYWWADVPVEKANHLFVKKGTLISEVPSVKYRGIFINDEAPALSNWAKEQFGGFNHQFYEKVFELLLRNKANYLWPAMWQPSAFADDDSLNDVLADEYGIVMSTSHHEPMMRAHEEWSRYKGGDWNYKTNKEKLREFWRGGIERMDNKESVVTVGMRGDGDEAMSEETAVDLLQTIVADQRKIIEEVTGKPAKETPQVWAVYKEVQDYYDKGMRVDDDITILFCDDNWGNIRILPKKEDLNREGGYGIYYHFDFVGGPVSYRWLNVTQIERVWEQMNLAYAWGVKDLWIVNVGDIKPMELPISFFLDFGYNTKSIRAKDLPDYYVSWSAQQFGTQFANDIAELLALYTKYNARRTPEMLKPNTYSLNYYREADRIIEEYTALLKKAESINEKLPQEYHSAFYQLVLSPIQLCCNLNQMYVASGKNLSYASQGRASTNYYAQKVKEYFEKDEELTRYFHEDLANGKWNHMMSQTHIGYTSWNNPPVNRMPSVKEISHANEPGLGYVLENDANTFGKSLPEFDPINDQQFYIEIYNTGTETLKYTLASADKWIKLSSMKGNVQHEERVSVSIDWQRAPKGMATGTIELSAMDKNYSINVPVRNISVDAIGYVENNGVVSIEAAQFAKKVDADEVSWIIVPNMGRTASAVTVEPANADVQTVGENAPQLEYQFTLFSEGDLKIESYLSQTLNYKKNEGLKFAIAIDDEEPQIINMNEGENRPDWAYPAWWNNSVTDHIKKKQSQHKSIKSGNHVLKVWMIDPGIVFQKFVIDAGGLKPSYLGPVESVHISDKTK